MRSVTEKKSWLVWARHINPFSLAVSGVGRWLVPDEDTYEEGHAEERPLHPLSCSFLLFRFFSYCLMRTWYLESCCWSLECPNGYTWYICTIMNLHCSSRLIDREIYLWYVADMIRNIKTIYIKLNTIVYICTKTCLELCSFKY